MGFFEQVKDSMPRVGNQDNFIGSKQSIPFPDELTKATVKRKKCNELADSFQRLHYDGKAERVRNCGTLFAFAYIFSEERLSLHRANFCRERLCPMCAMQRTRQVFAQVSQVMDEVERENSYLTPLFLTLTVRNCKAEDLSETLDVIFQGWRRLMNNDRIKRLVPGWFRALEITYNEEDDTYHPHMHAIMLVPPSYFTVPKDYMPTQRWVVTWRKAMRLDYDPVCDIRAIKGADAAVEDCAGAVAEVAKYTVKDGDYLKEDAALTDKLVQIFGAAIRGRRLYAFGGLMKEVAKRLKLQNLEEMEPGDVTDEKGVVLRKDVDYVLVFYRWNIGLSRYDYDGVT
jgi:plasmid rolling circle replication initiator protein Rep